ncbi:MAG: hypothetical protein WCX73_02675 [Candidatus Pacearchaeota archaeon]|jgi:hypothetical protein
MIKKLNVSDLINLADVLAFDSDLDPTEQIDIHSIRRPININSIFIPDYSQLNNDSYSN